MLVLTRKKGQKLIINDDIEIIILESRGDTVKIGIKAPKNVSVYREELYDEIKKANLQSVKDIFIPEFNCDTIIPNVRKDFASEYLDKLKSVTTKIKPE